MSRRRRTLVVTLPLFLLAAAAAADASAQEGISSPFRFVEETQSLGLFGGYALTDEGALDLGPESAYGVGLRYTLRISGPFTAEATATYLPATRTVFDTTRVDGGFDPLGEADLSLAILQAALRFDLTGPRTYYGFQPYIVTGIGAAVDVSDSDAAFRDELVAEAVDPSAVVYDFGTTFAAQVGAGIEWFVSRRVTVNADVRDLFWEIEAPAAFVEPGTGTEPALDVPSEEWVQNFVFQLGLSYRF
ncbi:MAG: outer membrane beta-barrel protein [Gemmatimonadota bacterium]